MANYAFKSYKEGPPS